MWFGPDRRATRKLPPMSGALTALRVSPVLDGDKGCRPFPASLSPLVSYFLRFASDMLSLDEAERVSSVATLPRCSGSSRNAVRLRSGMSVQLRGNPHTGAIVAQDARGAEPNITPQGKWAMLLRTPLRSSWGFFESASSSSLVRHTPVRGRRQRSSGH